MDLDPDKITNSMQDAAIQAEILKGFQQPVEPAPAQEGVAPPQPQQPQGQGPQAVADTSGGGGSQIGTGTAPLPGEEGFTGNVA